MHIDKDNSVYHILHHNGDKNGYIVMWIVAKTTKLNCALVYVIQFMRWSNLKHADCMHTSIKPTTAVELHNNALRPVCHEHIHYATSFK